MLRDKEKYETNEEQINQFMKENGYIKPKNGFFIEITSGGVFGLGLFIKHTRDKRKIIVKIKLNEHIYFLSEDNNPLDIKKFDYSFKPKSVYELDEDNIIIPTIEMVKELNKRID